MLTYAQLINPNTTQQDVEFAEKNEGERHRRIKGIALAITVVALFAIGLGIYNIVSGNHSDCVLLIGAITTVATIVMYASSYLLKRSRELQFAQMRSELAGALKIMNSSHLFLHQSHPAPDQLAKS